MAGSGNRPGRGSGGAVAAGPVKSVKLSASQRFVADMAKTAFNEPRLNGAETMGQAVRQVQRKFGVSNRMATNVLMAHGYRMGTDQSMWLDTDRALKFIRANRSRYS